MGFPVDSSMINTFYLLLILAYVKNTSIYNKKAFTVLCSICALYTILHVRTTCNSMYAILFTTSDNFS